MREGGWRYGVGGLGYELKLLLWMPHLFTFTKLGNIYICVSIRDEGDIAIRHTIQPRHLWSEKKGSSVLPGISAEHAPTRISVSHFLAGRKKTCLFYFQMRVFVRGFGIGCEPYRKQNGCTRSICAHVCKNIQIHYILYGGIWESR